MCIRSALNSSVAVALAQDRGQGGGRLGFVGSCLGISYPALSSPNGHRFVLPSCRASGFDSEGAVAGKKQPLFFEFSLCLSRACLGKNELVSYLLYYK